MYFKLFFMVTFILKSLVLLPLSIVEYVGTLWEYFKRKYLILLYPPGLFPLPWVGNIWGYDMRPLDFLLSVKQYYGNIVSMYLGPYPAIVVSNYKHITEILGHEASSGRPNFFGCSVGRTWKDRRTGVFSNEGEEFRAHRDFVLHKLYNVESGNNRANINAEIAISDEMREWGQGLLLVRDTPFESTDLFNSPLTNSLWTVVSGKRFDLLDPELAFLKDAISKHVRNIHHLSPMFYFPLMTKHFPHFTADPRYKKSIEAIMEFMRRKVNKYFEDIANDPNKLANEPPSLMKEYFIRIQDAANNPESEFYGDLGKENMITTLADLFIGGPEIVSATLTWAILYMIIHPEIQERMFQEIYSTLGDFSPVLENRDNLPFCRAVISEVLRCSSVVPLAPYHRTKDDLTYGRYVIPEDTLIVPNLHASHRDEAFWGPDVYTFNPDRFLIPSENRIHGKEIYDVSLECALLPFSIGQRSCIGDQFARDQLFLIFVGLIQIVKLLPHSSFKIDQLCLCMDCDQTKFVLAPKPFKFKLRLRSYLSPECSDSEDSEEPEESEGSSGLEELEEPEQVLE